MPDGGNVQGCELGRLAVLYRMKHVEGDRHFVKEEIEKVRFAFLYSNQRSNLSTLRSKPWENHITKASCCSWRVQGLIKPTLESHNVGLKSHALQLDPNIPPCSATLVAMPCKFSVHYPFD